jgi:hypothetical protein
MIRSGADSGEGLRPNRAGGQIFSYGRGSVRLGTGAPGRTPETIVGSRDLEFSGLGISSLMIVDLGVDLKR